MGKVVSDAQPLNHVKLTTNGNAGTVEIDGHDIAPSVRSFTLHAGVNEFPRLDVEIVPRQVAEYEGAAFVRLNPDFEEFLTMLGWTPPRRR